MCVCVCVCVSNSSCVPSISCFSIQLLASICLGAMWFGVHAAHMCATKSVVEGANGVIEWTLRVPPNHTHSTLAVGA